MPKIDGIFRERELGFAIIHYNKVAHTRSSCAAADYARFDYANAQGFARTRQSARRADNSSAYNCNVWLRHRATRRFPNRMDRRDRELDPLRQ
jgi:hypothetical protein